MSEQDINFAADEATFGLQLNREQAINFVIRNVQGATRSQAERAVNKSVSGYKQSLGG